MINLKQEPGWRNCAPRFRRWNESMKWSGRNVQWRTNKVCLLDCKIWSNKFKSPSNLVACFLFIEVLDGISLWKNPTVAVVNLKRKSPRSESVLNKSQPFGGQTQQSNFTGCFQQQLREEPENLDRIQTRLKPTLKNPRESQSGIYKWAICGGSGAPLVERLLRKRHGLYGQSQWRSTG